MSTIKGSPTVLKLHAQKQDNTRGEALNTDTYFELEETYLLTAAATESNVHNVQLYNGDYIELTFDDDSTWFGNRDTLVEIFPEINFQSRSGTPPVLPVYLSSDNDSRNVASQIVLKYFRKFSKKKADIGIIEIAEAIETKTLNGRSGLYNIGANFEILDPIKHDYSKPILLFLHGTISSTNGSFSDLRRGTIWQELRRTYGVNILAFEH